MKAADIETGYANWAHAYRDAGWGGVLPLPPNAKSPVPTGYTGYRGAVPDDAQIGRWARSRRDGNVALRMPVDVIGIDVDSYPYTYEETDEQTGEKYEVNGYKQGAATLAALEAELGPLPATWRSSSRGDGPSGIRLYRVPPGLHWGDFGLHVEAIWWGHRYTVVYPSTNPDSGRMYRWIDDAAARPVWGVYPPKTADLPELPAAWVDRFGRDPSAPKPVRPPVAGLPPRPAPAVHASGERRRFTRAQAAAFVQPHLDELRATRSGDINNQLNRTAKVVSHFVPGFWSPLEARVLLLDALSATGYDHMPSAEKTIRSAMESTADAWTAELAPDLVPRTPRPVAGPYDAEPPTPVQPSPDGMDEAVDGFWDRRPFLRYVHTYARSRYCAPWAVLGGVLTLAVSAVEPNITLPPIIGTDASLNMFVGLIGPSGGGKDIAFGVARKLLDIRCGMEEIPTDVIPLGSGEGLSHIYMKHPPKLTKRRAKDDDDSELIGLAANADPDTPVQYRTRALVTIKEIDTLDAIGQRRGSTLGGQLRQGWSGDQIGFHYVDTTKRMIVPEHAYRLCIIAGVQPGRAGALLSGAEADGGTPQRFLWLPATDPSMTIDAPDTPEPVAWSPPRYIGRARFDVCPTAHDVILEAHVKRNRGDGDALDGHALLLRLKVAAALAMLDSREPRMQCTVTEEDWELSGVVMAVSDRTRASVQQHLADARRVENEKAATAEAHKTIVMSQVVENEAERKAQRWVLGRLSADTWTRSGELREAAGRHKKVLNEVLAALVQSGRAEVQTYPGRGQEGREYRLSGDAQ